ncbi:MAG: glycosyltransferase family 2 protein [Acidovorax soli]|uniref:glycosyltransferase family 2 protein n=1 Tax=Acidovorax soli TaxID=592050 RepID=UPI0026F052C4|nr:glycosyltransferase family 2 protein [Acidovorax soli]MCM2345408.1 glycosyltransferase family 2 protein [Acidovorax soli]
MELSIIIVNFNGKHFLENCLQSIREHVQFEHEVIVVDNASTDGSAEYLRGNFPDVKLIVSPENRGFTGGNNLGAQEAKGRYLLLLNNDTVITSLLDPLIEMMQREAGIGALGCNMVYGDGRLQESVGYEHTALRILLSWMPIAKMLPDNIARRTVSATSSFYQKDAAEADWVSGAFLITPSLLWNRLGGLDENYFMYIEDVDYCRRVHDEGLRVMYSNLAKITHFEGGGRSWIGRRAVLNTASSYLIYASKFYGVLGRVSIRTVFPVIFLARAMSHWLMHVMGRDVDGNDKAAAFRAAAWSLLVGVRAT